MPPRFLVAGALSVSSVYAQNDWCKSKWGPNDEIGAANLLTPQLALERSQARQERQGVPAWLRDQRQGQPAFPPRTWGVTVLQPGQAGGCEPGRRPRPPTTTTSSHGLGRHRLAARRPRPHRRRQRLLQLQQGHRFVQADGLKKLGIEKVPADRHPRRAARHGGHSRPNPSSRKARRSTARRSTGAMKRQGVKIGKGDVVLFHTGWTKLIGKDNKRYGAGEPGLGMEGAQYLASLGSGGGRRRHLGPRGDPVREGRRRVRSAPDPAAAQRHLHPREHEHRADGEGQGVGVHVRARQASRITGAVQAIINPVAIR